MWDAIPYCGAGPGPAEAWSRWNTDPLLLTGLALLLGWALLRPASRRGMALLAWSVLVVAFVSPLCALSSALFAARTLHHVLLIGVAAPLLALALRDGTRRRAGAWLSLALPLHVVILWLWHAPPAYAAALSGDAVYWGMQATLLGSALVFWAAALGRRDEAWPYVSGLLAMMAQMGLLGALITFAPAALYAPHLATTQAWGFSPLQDQQLAGLIMWVPASLIYLLAALVRAGRWLDEAAPERDA